jgi:hypothetical protein
MDPRVREHCSRKFLAQLHTPCAARRRRSEAPSFGHCGGHVRLTGINGRGHGRCAGSRSGQIGGSGSCRPSWSDHNPIASLQPSVRSASLVRSLQRRVNAQVRRRAHRTRKRFIIEHRTTDRGRGNFHLSTSPNCSASITAVSATPSWPIAAKVLGRRWNSDRTDNTLGLHAWSSSASATAADPETGRRRKLQRARFECTPPKVGDHDSSVCAVGHEALPFDLKKPTPVGHLERTRVITFR